MGLKLNTDENKVSYEAVVESELIKKSIVTLEKTILEINNRYSENIQEIEEEKDYELYIKIGLGIVVLLFLFKLTFSSFFFVLIMVGLYLAFKKFLSKEARIADLKQQCKVELKEKEELLRKQRLKFDVEVKKINLKV
jgi:hypothetical protein